MKNHTDKSDNLWMTDAFEDTVAAALISCFETKIKKNKGACPSDRMSEEKLSIIRSEGPYIPSNSRVMEAPNDKTGRFMFDLTNDILPVRGCFAFAPDVNHPIQIQYPATYFAAHHIRQVNQLGKNWHKQSSGVLYEMLHAYACNDKIEGDRAYFTVSKNGEVFPCFQSLQQNTFGGKNKVVTTEDFILKGISFTAGATLNVIADRAFCWTITAQEKNAKAHLGCMQEEIKSLLYARNLPLSSTGRKRPILHLVEAHKRRIKAGTDIDITSFLRGQQTVEMNGTVFRIRPPQAIQKSLSVNSQKYLITP